jgi:hypothetical protein
MIDVAVPLEPWMVRRKHLTDFSAQSGEDPSCFSLSSVLHHVQNATRIQERRLRTQCLKVQARKHKNKLLIRRRRTPPGFP